MSVTMRSASRLMRAAHSFMSASRTMPQAIISAKPAMLVSGERSSWETLATKLRRESSSCESSLAMRLMELPSTSSSPRP